MPRKGNIEYSKHKLALFAAKCALFITVLYILGIRYLVCIDYQKSK